MADATDNNVLTTTDEIGVFARHPLRTMAGAFLAGTAIGMLSGKKEQQNRHWWS